MRIYVASSWRNPHLDQVVKDLRAAGHEVYDFREDDAFDWKQIDGGWESWTPEKFRDVIWKDGLAITAFHSDFSELKACDGVLLVLPCNRSAHIELGFAIGQDKPTAILMQPGERPELMYRAAGRICLDMAEVLAYFHGGREIEAGDAVRHYPSGELWYVVGVDRARAKICVAGWPPTMANLNDCALVEKGQGLTAEELAFRDRTFGSCWATPRMREVVQP